MNADESSRVEARKRELYQPGSVTREEELHGLTSEQYEVPSSWAAAEITKPRAPLPKVERPQVPTSIKVLHALTAVVLAGALAAFGYLGYNLLTPGSHPTPDAIDMVIDMPVGADPARPVDITLRITNRNTIALDGAEALFKLPDGSFLSSRGTTTLLQSKDAKIPIGVIASGETVERKISAYVLGAEQEQKNVGAQLTFQFLGIEESKFTKETAHPVRILASPVIVTVESLARVSSGAPFGAKLTVRSNTVVPLSNLLMSVAYPPGFVFQESEPKPTSGDHVWALPDLAEGKSFEYNIIGVFASGGIGDRVFHTEVGPAKQDNVNELAAGFGRTDTNIAIEAPFVDAHIRFGASEPGQVVAREGVPLSGKLILTNATKRPIDHVVAEINIEGAYDSGSVDAQNNGVYRAGPSTITWDERSESRLTQLLPGASVSLSFSLVPRAGKMGQDGSAPVLNFAADVRAIRTAESGVSGEASSLAVEKVVLATQASFISRGLHFSGPFKDLGPVPPQVDKETQYTVVWSLRNTTNTLENAVVTAKLAPAVSWTGQVDTEATSTITFDEASHTVTWRVGKLAGGAGVGARPPREIAFQVALTPAQSMISLTPKLLVSQEFNAKDLVTGQMIRVTSQDLDASLVSDPQAPKEAGKVAP